MTNTILITTLFLGRRGYIANESGIIALRDAPESPMKVHRLVGLSQLGLAGLTVFVQGLYKRVCMSK